MKHYSQEEWADFARDVGEPGQRASMQEHLDTGCIKCKKELGLWQRVHAAARRESAVQVPDSLVRSVKGAFAIYGPGRAQSAKPTIAQLIFDSLRGPLPAGVRSTSAAPRQLLYGAGEHHIDLRFEPGIDTERVSLVGQILNSSDPEKGVDAVPIVLMRGRQILSESSTNGFGEFHLDCTMETGLKLRIKLPRVNEIFIPLADSAETAVADGSDPTEPAAASHRSKSVKRRGRKKH
jgi:hypothetical protein